MKRSYASLLLGCLPLLAVACGSAPAPVAPATSEAPSTTAEPPPPPAPEAEPEPPPPPPEWGYAGAEAPAKWATLSSEWALCGSGKEQSPVDLPAKGDKPAKPDVLKTTYQKVPLRLFNNGHTVEASGEGIGSLQVGDAKYSLVQLHLHAPSEHTVGGKPAAMELHLVHRSEDGKLAVVAILLDKGKKNAALDPIFAAAPKNKSEEPSPVPDASLDLSKLIPSKAAYYGYSGSLTTPPCTEGVSWMVLSKPLEVSAEQLTAFRAVMAGDNARPVQPLNARKIYGVKP